MEFRCVSIPPDGSPREFPATVLPHADLQRLCCGFILASSLVEDDPVANMASRLLDVPKDRSERSRLLRSFLLDTTRPEHPHRLLTGRSGWFPLAGAISIPAPGLYLLAFDVLDSQASLIWSPGQVRDVLRAVSYLSPILESHGHSPSLHIGGVGARFSALLNVADSHDAYLATTLEASADSSPGD